MPYNEELESRIRQAVKDWEHTDVKNMFGGICHLINGNMFCGVHKDSLILRLGAENAERALSQPNVRPFDITGRPMKGWIMVESGGYASDEDLRSWLDKAKEFALDLPKK